MYKTKQRQQTFQKVVGFFVMWVQKESSKSSQMSSPAHLLIYHISDKMKIYYFKILILSTHPFFFFQMATQFFCRGSDFALRNLSSSYGWSS